MLAAFRTKKNFETYLFARDFLIYFSPFCSASPEIIGVKISEEGGFDLTDILLNRMHILNGKLEKNLINLSMNSYKVKCKELFLQV